MQQFSKYQHSEYQLYNCEQLQGPRTRNYDEDNTTGWMWEQRTLRGESKACGESSTGCRAWSEQSQVRADADTWTNQIRAGN